MSSEDVEFLAGAALSLFAPPLLYFVLSGQLWPLYLMACNVASGSALGFMLFKKSPEDFLSCVPRTNTPQTQSGPSTDGLSRAA